MSISGARGSSNLRNERVELLVDFALKRINPKNIVTERHFMIGPKGFGTEFDHKVTDNRNKILFLGQTTCYKEKGSGGEPNKTYEMRETIIEQLLVYVNISVSNLDIDSDQLRFFHIIIGDPKYSYAYFDKLRREMYDLSIVINPKHGVNKLYLTLEEILSEEILVDEDRALASINSAIISGKYSIISEAVSQITNYFDDYQKNNYARSAKGRLISQAIMAMAKDRDKRAQTIVKTQLTGLGIKKAYLLEAKGIAKSENKEITQVVRQIYGLRPFLPEAKIALAERKNWSNYVDGIVSESKIKTTDDLIETIRKLWIINNIGKRELIRRILVKLPTVVVGKGADYPQDLPIPGVTEHTLYGKDLNPTTTAQICNYLAEKMSFQGINSNKLLIQKINEFGRSIVKDSFDYDVENGTVIKPVQYFVVNLLQDQGYLLKTPTEAFGSKLLAFYGELFDLPINAFSSILVICTKEGKPLALFKAKFFRPQEFDRRVKEEGFLSISSAFKVVNTKGVISLAPNLPGIPRIMFIDSEPGRPMDKEAIMELVRMGWDVVVTPEAILRTLKLLAMPQQSPK